MIDETSPGDYEKAVNNLVLADLRDDFRSCPLHATDDLTAAVISMWRSRIDACRHWAASLSNELVQKSYLNWMNYYERCLKDAVKELAFIKLQKSITIPKYSLRGEGQIVNDQSIKNPVYRQVHSQSHGDKVYEAEHIRLDCIVR